MTTNQQRPTWEEVMKPLADSPLWPFLRNAASKLLESRLRSQFGDDHGFGISGSDINHTIFGVASFTPNRDSHTYPSRVLNGLMDEAEGY